MDARGDRALLKSTAAKHGLKPPQVMMALRVLVAGTPQTPAIDAVLALLGRETVRARIGRLALSVAASGRRRHSREADQRRRRRAKKTLGRARSARHATVRLRERRTRRFR